MHLDRWSTQIAERIKLSPPADAWYSAKGRRALMRALAMTSATRLIPRIWCPWSR